MNRYLVLHVRPYDFEDDGRRISGATVTYVDSSNTFAADGERGFPPLSLSVAAGMEREFPEVPGFYHLDFSQRRGKNGRPQLALTGARLVAGLDLDRPGSSSGTQKGV